MRALPNPCACRAPKQAPEVLNLEYGFPSDVWACGVMMFFVLSGEFPFKGRNKMELARKVFAEEPNMDSGGWEQVSAEAKDCIR